MADGGDGGSSGHLFDFFVASVSVDGVWAEWIAWHLADAGYSVHAEAWNFASGTHRVTELNKAIQNSERTVVVVSRAYLASHQYMQLWQTAWALEPPDAPRQVVLRIEPCDPPGIFGQLTCVDLFDLSEDEARERLVAASGSRWHKPAGPPRFPGRREVLPPAGATAGGARPRFPPDRAETLAPNSRPRSGRRTGEPRSRPVGDGSLGTVRDRYLTGAFAKLRDIAMPLGPLLGDLRLTSGNADLEMFTGRDVLLAEIDQYVAARVATRQGGYLLVEAEAGMGKSALATYLAHKKPWPTYVTRLRPRTPEQVRADLVAQLVGRWNLASTVSGGVLPDRHDTSDFLENKLYEAAERRDETEPGMPVVLVVDGLDEAPTPEPGEMPFGLPHSLPAGTVVIVTTRPGAGLPRRIRPKRLRIKVDDPVNLRDLAAHIRRVTNTDPKIDAALAGFDREQFCHTLLERSSGVWIYAAMVLDQIRDGERSAADVDRLPMGLANYYADNIDRWRTSPQCEWDHLGRSLLATLAAACDAWSAENLADLAGVDRHGAAQLLFGPFKPFLSVTKAADNRTYLFAVGHQSLRDLCEHRLPDDTADHALELLAQELESATRAAHHRITEALAPSGDFRDGVWAPPGDYASQHLAHHAAACGRLDELCQDPAFLATVEPSSLLRRRHQLGSDAAKLAVTTVETASSFWRDDHDDRLRWIELAARRLGADWLAAAAQHLLQPSWHPRAVAWSGSSHRVLRSRGASVDVMAAVPVADGGSWLAAADNDHADGVYCVRVWDPDTAAELMAWREHKGPVNALLPLPRHEGGDALLASASDDGTIRLWELDNAKAVGVLSGHTDSVRTLALVPRRDGAPVLASAGGDGSVLLWDLDQGVPVVRLRPDGVPAAPVVKLDVVRKSDGRVVLVSAGRDGSLRLWDVDSETQVTLPTGCAGPVRGLAKVPRRDGTTLLASAGGDQLIRLWDPTTGKLDNFLSVGADWADELVLLPRPGASALLACIGGDGSIHLWNSDTWAPVEAPRERVGPFRALVGSGGPRALLAYAADDASLRLWDLETEAEVAVLTDHSSSVSALVALPRPEGPPVLVSADEGGAVRLWDAGSVAPQVNAAGHGGPVRRLLSIQSPGADLLATAGDDGSVRLWHPDTATEVVKLSGFSDPVDAVVVVPRPAGQAVLAAAAGDGPVLLWQADDASPMATLLGHVGRVAALAVVPRDHGSPLLATGGDDGYVLLWDLDLLGGCGVSLDPLARFGGRAGQVRELAVVPRPGGWPLLAAASRTGSVSVWDPVTSAQVADLTGHTSAITALAVVPRANRSSLLASADDIGSLRLWDAGTWQFAQNLTGHTDPISELAVIPGPNGITMLVSADHGGSVMLWDPNTMAVDVKLRGHTGMVTALAAVPRRHGSALLASAEDRYVRLWDLDTATEVAMLAGHTEPVRALTVVQGGDGVSVLVSAGDDRSIVVWEERAPGRGPSV